METISYDEFGQAKRYESPSIDGFEPMLIQIINDIFDSELVDKNNEEKLSFLNTPINTIVQNYVGVINSSLPENCGLDRVDGFSITNLVSQVLLEKISLIG